MNRAEARAAIDAWACSEAEQRTGFPHQMDDGIAVPIVTDAYRDHVIAGIAKELDIDFTA